MKAFLLNLGAILMGSTVLTLSGFGNTHDRPVLVLRLMDRAATPSEVLADAMAHVSRIYLAAGIRTVWLNDKTEAGIALNALELTLVLVDKDASNAMCPEETVTGIALSNNGQGSRRAYIFATRVIRQAERSLTQVRFLNRPKAWGLILGHVIAHELGHLMLPHGSHASSGIMRGQFQKRDVEDAVRGLILFNDNEAGVIRSVLGYETTES